MINNSDSTIVEVKLGRLFDIMLMMMILLVDCLIWVEVMIL